MVKKTVEEVARGRPEPPFMEVREADDVTDGGVQFVLVAGDNPLRLHGVCHQTEEPILDEPRHDLITEA
jgi:hypothetical protein